MADLPRLPGAASLDEVIAVIDRDGGVIMEDFLAPATIAELKADLLPKLEACSAGPNDFSGFRTRRMSALFAKSRRVADVVIHRHLQQTDQVRSGCEPRCGLGQRGKQPHDGCVVPCASPACQDDLVA
jgi:hypothetical protein